MPEVRCAGLVPVAILLAVSLTVGCSAFCGTKAGRDNVPDPGVTVRGEVPTPGEPAAADNVAPGSGTRKEPRVVPFHKKPPPVELPAEERK